MKIKYPSTKTLTVSVENFQSGLDTETAENVNDFNVAVNCYNFDSNSGALTESIGFEELTIPSSTEDNSSENSPLRERVTRFVKMGVYKQFDTTENKRTDKLIAITDDLKVEFCRLVTQYPAFMNLDEKQYTEIPNLLNYNDGENDCILFSSEKDGLFSWDDKVETKQWVSAPVVTNICVHKGRTFITEGGERLTIRTEPSNLTQWTTSPTIDNVYIPLSDKQGRVNNLLVMNDYIFAIRDYGITRVDWYNRDDAYDVTNLLFSGGRIYGRTACVCGNFGIVLCKDGIYKFDSVSAEKLDLKINNLIKGVSNTNAVGAFRNGIYYLACRLNFDDDQQIGCEQAEYKNNAVLIYDVATDKWSLSRGADIIDLCAVQFESVDKLLACFNTNDGVKIGQLVHNGKFFNDIQQKYWRSPLSDLGYSDKEKCIKEISVMSEYDCIITVQTEVESREFEVKGSSILNRFPVRLKGKQVGVAIKSDTEKSLISNLKLTVDIMDINYV